MEIYESEKDYAKSLDMQDIIVEWTGVYVGVLFDNNYERIDVFSKKSKINIGKFVFIRKNTTIRIDGESTLDIGDHVFMNDNCNINCANKISIGSYTKIAPNVSINDHDHNYKGVEGGNLIKGEVIIGKNVWIGNNVCILSNVIIGDGVIVGANSVVTHDIPSYYIAAGIPAKIIKKIK